jgi:hypothetical protein
MLQQSHIPLTNGIMSFLEASEDHDLAPIGIGSMHEQAQKLAEYGRHGDIYVVHAAEGETVIPLEVLNANPKVKDMLFNQMREMGLDPEEFVVGNELNSINPVTGMPEFFFSKIWRSVKKVASKAWKGIKAAAPYVLPLVFSAFGVPFLSGMAPGLFGAGSFGAAFLGSGIGTLAGGGSMKDALKAGAMAGVMNFGLSGARSAFTGGDFMQGAMDSVYNPQAADFGTQWGRFTEALDPAGAAGSFDAFVGGQAPTPPDQISLAPSTLGSDFTRISDRPITPTGLTERARLASLRSPEPYNLRQPFNVATTEAANIPVPSTTADFSVGGGMPTPKALQLPELNVPPFPGPTEFRATSPIGRGSAATGARASAATGARASVEAGARARAVATKAAEKAMAKAEKAAPWYKSIPSPYSTRIGPTEFVDALGKGVDVSEKAMEAAIGKVNPNLISDYSLVAGIPAAGLTTYLATQSESEDERKKREAEEAADKERERQARLREWHKTTGTHLFAQSQIGGPSNPDYWNYMVRGMDPHDRPGEWASPWQGTRPYSWSAAEGGMAEYPRRDLLVEGPGTERSDDIPAMLSDGEFVMNARAVRGADPSGRGNRYAGANNLYNMMRNFEMRS